MGLRVRYLAGSRVVPFAVVKWHPSMEFCLEQVIHVYHEVLERDPILTGGQEDSHSDGSLHYGRGEDPRSRAADFDDDGISPGQKRTIKAKLKARLGNQFDVIWEKHHLHIEYQFRP